MQLSTAPFGSQEYSPGVPHDMHFAFVLPHQLESHDLKLWEQHPFPDGVEGVGWIVGDEAVGGEGGDATGFDVKMGEVTGGDVTGDDVSIMQGADDVSGLQIIPGQHGFL